MILTEEGETSRKLDLSRAGTQYMVIDLGGGTADITVHEKNIDGTLKEIHAASGGAWGGTVVDRNFIQLLKDILGKDEKGKDIMDRFANEKTEDMLDLMREFEAKKRTIHPNSKPKVTLKIPISLKETYEQSGNTIESAIAKSPYKEKITCPTADKMRINVDVLRGLFIGPINSIVSHVQELFKHVNLNEVSTLILVGGFSECTLVQQKIAEAFPDKETIVPAECGLAVLKGAVVFGHRPESVSTRITTCTYGDEIMQRFKPSEHLAEYKIMRDGIEHCNHCFRTYVGKGQRITLGYEVTHKTFPLTDSQKNIAFSLFTSDSSTDPKYVTDKSCRLLGTLTVPLAEGATKDEKEIQTTMVLGDTELMFKAKQTKTGKMFRKFFRLP